MGRTAEKVSGFLVVVIFMVIRKTIELVSSFRIKSFHYNKENHKGL